MSKKRSELKKPSRKELSRHLQEFEEGPTPAKSSNRYSIAFYIVCLVCLIAGLVLFYHWAKGVSGIEVDDAGITFSFANNLAEGYGIVLYPDGERVEGYSNPLWMFSQALGKSFGIEPMTTSRTMGYLLGALTLIFLALFAWRGFGGRVSFAIALVPLFLAVHGAFSVWALSGMESPLYIFLMVAASYRLFRECESENPASLPISPLLFFLLSITRPEGIVLFVFAVAYRMIAVVIPKRKVSAKDGLWLAFFVVPWGAYQIWHYVYFAWPFPNTYYGKVVERSLAEVFSKGTSGYRYLAGYLKDYGLGWLLWLSPFAFFAKKALKKAAFLCAMTCFAMFFPLYSNGDWMAGYRFCAPIAAPLFLLAAMGVDGIANLVLLILRKKEAFGLVSILGASAFLLAGLVLLYVPSRGQYEKYRERPAARIMGIKGRADYFRKLARDFRFRDFESAVVDMDMGAMSMFSKTKLIDVGRICNVPMAHNYYDRENRKRFMNEYVLVQNNPEFAHVRRAWGKRTTLPGNPSFRAGYILLPRARGLGRKEQGNYIRKDLFLFDRLPEPGNEVSFLPGLTLLSSRPTPEIVERGQRVWFRQYWRRKSDLPLDNFRFRFRFVSEDGEVIQKKAYKPIMGIYPTSNWKKGQIIGEWAKARIPKKTPKGVYQVFLQVMDAVSNEVFDEQALGISLKVDGDAARAQGAEIFDQAILAVADGRMDQALSLYDEAGEYYGGRLPSKMHKRFQAAFCDRAIEIGATEVAQGNRKEGERVLILARQRYPRHDKINGLLWQLAKKEASKGKQAMKLSDPEKAWRFFENACRLQPQHSWARRWAEEARSFRYGRDRKLSTIRTGL